ncbi:hypothetical protein LNKW23_00770 [Paralimibaculum aggregatum]|uniref:Uncharacterized protein n=1 Tax=Paralimibaculum aggregatum TaxID=3036245 RepID=A0ABQ6LBT4_9RHOB|nr:hypothetical protein LNKW23_00770 [Limibaculum sp. NKW23]
MLGGGVAASAENTTVPAVFGTSPVKSKLTTAASAGPQARIPRTSAETNRRCMIHSPFTIAA